MELSIEKKRELLNFWFYYYGKVMYSLKELETFHNLLDSNLEGVEKVAVANFINSEGSTIFVLAIRQGSELELLDTLDFSDSDEDPTKSEPFMKLTDEFYDMVIKAYEKPDPAIPLEDEVIIEQLNDMVKRNRKDKGRMS